MRPPKEAMRVSTGVPGLNSMLSGGFLPGDSTLVAGSPGTGKTTLGLHFIAAGVENGENAVYVTFEYLPQQIARDARAKGWPVDDWEREGRLKLICTTPDILLASSGDGWSILDEAIREVGARRLVIDSMAHFEFYEPDPHKLRPALAGLMNHLRLLDVTTIVTHEIAQIVGPTMSISNWGLEFLVDNVVLLRYVELEGELAKALNVMKFRGGDHDRRFRGVRLTAKGMVVEDAFHGVENISSGSARRSLTDRAEVLV